jgi:hypothetical protein
MSAARQGSTGSTCHMDYEALPEVSEAMVTLAAIRLMLHRLARPNSPLTKSPWLDSVGHV